MAGQKNYKQVIRASLLHPSFLIALAMLIAVAFSSGMNSILALSKSVTFSFTLPQNVGQFRRITFGAG